VEAILGYPYSNFFEGGVLFFYTTIPSENIESIKHQTEKHFQQLFHPSFKIESHQLFKTNGAARLSNGERINVLQQAVLLDFYAEDKSFFVIGVWGKTSGINEEVLIKRTANTDRVLKNIKTAYMTLYPERFQTNNHILTSREREIILLLSRGYSTKQVSQQLKISFHTVETHRKKLLRKWNARNTAQLIKEVSKFMNW
jgi:DNA-binding CsgD family transcriptional regulator